MIAICNDNNKYSASLCWVETLPYYSRETFPWMIHQVECKFVHPFRENFLSSPPLLFYPMSNIDGTLLTRHHFAISIPDTLVSTLMWADCHQKRRNIPFPKKLSVSNPLLYKFCFSLNCPLTLLTPRSIFKMGFAILSVCLFNTHWLYLKCHTTL